MNDSISVELSLHLIVPEQTRVALIAGLYYSKEDPYAIRMAFHVGLEEPVEWIFARELLYKGIEGREGLGDVVVWPDGDGAVHIELSSPFGNAHFEADMEQVSNFLERTYAIIPQGEEGSYLNLGNDHLEAFLRKNGA